MGASDGDLTAGQILDAIGSLLARHDLRTTHLPAVRDLIVDGFLDLDQGQVAVPSREHDREIEPAVELATHLVQLAHDLETASGVQVDRQLVARLDHGDHAVEAALSGMVDRLVDQPDECRRQAGPREELGST